MAECEGPASQDLVTALREAGLILIQIVAPMMPHLAEECWSVLGGQGLVAEAAWPVADRGLIIENEFTYPVQINGKKRADLTIARDADQKTVEMAVLALDAVQKALDNQVPKKIIVVPQRIVNVVV
jgi:leucyl-tRNA synthetase